MNDEPNIREIIWAGRPGRKSRLKVVSLIP